MVYFMVYFALFHLEKPVLQLYSFFCFTVPSVPFLTLRMDFQKVGFQHVMTLLLFVSPLWFYRTLCVCSISFIPPALKSEKLKWLKTVNLVYESQQIRFINRTKTNCILKISCLILGKAEYIFCTKGPTHVQSCSLLSFTCYCKPTV